MRKHDIYLGGPDKGIWDALNKGLEVSDSPIIGWLGSDDFFSISLLPEEIINKLATKENLDALIFGTAFYSNKKITRSFPPPNLDYRYGGAIPHYSSFWKRKFIDKDRFDVSLKYSSDLDFFYRQIVIKKAKFETKKELVTYMQIGGVTTKNLSSIILQNIECYSVYKRYLPAYNALIAVTMKTIRKYLVSKKYSHEPIIEELTSIIIGVSCQ
jgi:hypothetical protein